MIAPSLATDHLAEIAYHVTFQKSHSKPNAEKKRRKWSQIPAFLVAMVRAEDPLYSEDSDTTATSREDDQRYKPLDFVPLQTEREMEDVSHSFSQCLIGNPLCSMSLIPFFLLYLGDSMLRRVRLCKMYC